MPTRETAFAPGTPCWVDLMTSDPAASQTFYRSLFGWTFTESNPDFGGYVNCLSDGIKVGGLMGKPDMQPGPDAWTTFLATQDLALTLKNAASAGAQITFDAHPVGDLGIMSHLTDPGGAGIGLWQAGQHTGFGKYNEPGSVTWNELYSRNYDATRAFYTSVFGWTEQIISDTSEFRYLTGLVDGNVVAGMTDAANLPADVPAHWAVYFSVENADVSTARAVEVGATLVQEPSDSPYGRMSELRDPTGADFRLHQVLAG